MGQLRLSYGWAVNQDAVEYYRQMLGAAPGLNGALCLTYAAGPDPAGLIRAFGGDPDATMSQSDLSTVLDQYHYSQVPPALLVAGRLDHAG